MSSNQDEVKNGKKNRKRLKRLYQQIREQMEFYLSDANLQKDRFFMQQMTSSADGCIDLDVFLRCNKILSLTSDIEVLMNAVATSETLVVDKKKKTVSRVTPYREPRDVDERTVYAECLPMETDREWIRKVFGVCGKIIYISLPRFKSTGDIKGFAFVEYETVESARKACKLINHPPAKAKERVGRFPRNKQLAQLEKEVHFQETVHGRKRRASESEMETVTAPSIKRKRTMSEGENEEVSAPLTAPPAEQEPPPTVRRKRVKSSDTGEGKNDSKKDPTVKSEMQTVKSRKRKTSECGDVGISLEAKSETQSRIVAETTSKSKKAKKELKATKLPSEKTDLKPSGNITEAESAEDLTCVEIKPESTKKSKKKEESLDSVIETKTKALKRKSEEDDEVKKKQEENLDSVIETKTKALKRKSEADEEVKEKKQEEDLDSGLEAETKTLKHKGGADEEVEEKKKENLDSVVESKTKALKRKGEGDESFEKKAKKVNISDEQALLEAKVKFDENKADGETGDKTNKKKRHKKNKKSKIKDVPELRVIPKKEWLDLRVEYLRLQKSNMTQLKDKLKEIHNEEREKTKPVVRSFATHEEKESDAKKKSEPEFIEGVIVKVTTDQPITRKDLKERIWVFGSIAYIDLGERDTSGHVRCNDQASAVAISQASIPGYTFLRLSGADEQSYWQKLVDDRKKRLSTKTRPKQRGRDKIQKKADVAYEKVKKPVHIVFD